MKNKNFSEKLHENVQLFCYLRVRVKGRGVMEHEKQKDSLKQRIQRGKVSRSDVIRRLAELAFGKANDCVRLALEDDAELAKLDLSLLSEIKRNEKGTVEIKLIDRLKALEQLALATEEEGGQAEEFLRSLIPEQEHHNGLLG